MKKKINKNALFTALALALGSTMPSGAVDNSQFNVNDLGSNTTLIAHHKHCGGMCGTKKINKLFKDAGMNKKMSHTHRVRKKSRAHRCGEGICGTKKISNLFKDAGMNKKMR